MKPLSLFFSTRYRPMLAMRLRRPINLSVGQQLLLTDKSYQPVSDATLIPAVLLVTQVRVAQDKQKIDKVFSLFVLGAIALLFYLHDKAKRERNITGLLIPESELIISNEHLKIIGKKPRGDLSGAIVSYEKNGVAYLEKGAQDYEALVIEVIYSNLLSLLRPGVQPVAKIAQEKLNNGYSRFYSLSQMVENAVDIEQFIRDNKDWEEKLGSKPIKGLDVSLALDFMLAKHRDMKLANYLIIDQGSSYEIATIDHEFANRGITHNEFFDGIASQHFLDEMVQCVKDLYPPSDENKSGLAGDIRAKRFFEIARPQMTIENVNAVYKKVAELNYDRLIDLTEKLNKSGFLNESELQHYQTHLFAIRDAAQVAIHSISEKGNASTGMMQNLPQPLSFR